MNFPVDLNKFKNISFSLEKESLSNEDLTQLKNNIEIVREAIVVMTAYSNKKGIGGHTGGAYDIVPEILINEAFMQNNDNIYPVHFDDAGHRVAVQYVLSAIKGHIKANDLLHYREFDKFLPGHPEVGITPGVEFSSGRLGHMWSYVNGIALSNPGKTVILYSSDGALQEGNNAEAARFAVSQNINIKIIVDDNNVTITDYVSNYIPGFSTGKTLEGHGLKIINCDGENIEELYKNIRTALLNDGPVAIINKRFMAPEIPIVENTCKAHDALALEPAVKYLEQKGNNEAIKMLENAPNLVTPVKLKGVTEKQESNRKVFGQAVVTELSKLPDAVRKETQLAIDSDLAGSCGLNYIKDKYPEIYIQSGIMERNNISAAAGFGYKKGRQGIFGTFAAFQEMLISEITMARLNKANALIHLSHSSVDDMSDNTCHFGWNNFFAATNIKEDNDSIKLYFPADGNQMRALIASIFNDTGLRFVYSNRASVPTLLDESGKEIFSNENYKFTGKDEVIREGKDGYIVSYGETLYRCLHVVEELKEEGISIGLINKPFLNKIDEDMMNKIGKAPLVMLFEGQNENTGLGIRFGTWLLERGYAPKYAYYGATKDGNCGMQEQFAYQGLDPKSIKEKILKILK